jgi:hypothetical protein
MKLRWNRILRLLGIAPVLALLVGVTAPVQAQRAGECWNFHPFIAIVYPEGGMANLANSTRVNISVWPRHPVQCNCRHPWFEGRTGGLYVARDNEPMELVATPDEGEWMLRWDGDHWFPSFEFNDIPADLRGGRQMRFAIGANQGVLGGNVWVHATDARTLNPQPVVPTGYAQGTAGVSANLRDLDARIQIVWPHDGKGNPMPVDSASRVNLAVEIFEHGTLKAVHVPAYCLILWAAKGNDGSSVLTRLGQPRGENLQPPELIDYQVGGETYPRHVFNDIQVDPGQPMHFMVEVRDPAPGSDKPPFAFHSSVWTHALDARTYQPQPQPPAYGTESWNTAQVMGCSQR